MALGRYHVIILSCNLATYITYVDVKSRIAINVVRERERKKQEDRETERQRGSVHCPDFTCNRFYLPTPIKNYIIHIIFISPFVQTF